MSEVPESPEVREKCEKAELRTAGDRLVVRERLIAVSAGVVATAAFWFSVFHNLWWVTGLLGTFWIGWGIYLLLHERNVAYRRGWVQGVFATVSQVSAGKNPIVLETPHVAHSVAIGEAMNRAIDWDQATEEDK